MESLLNKFVRCGSEPFLALRHSPFHGHSSSLFFVVCRQLPVFEHSETHCDALRIVTMPFGLTIGTERAIALQNSIQDELTRREYSADAGMPFCS